MQALPRSFYQRGTVAVARDLIGKTLVRKIGKKILTGVISETEAYTAKDPASHAFKGVTPKNAVMFGEAGHAYVYFIYGNHHCLNVVAKSRQPAGAVLIRGIISPDGTAEINGPGKLTKILKIGRAMNGTDMTAKNSGLYVIDSDFSGKIMRTPRIGISSAKEKKWRFVAKG